LSWNLNEFNKDSNTKEILGALAETMEGFDVIVLTEVMNPESSKPPLDELAKHLKKEFKFVFMGERCYSVVFINPKKLKFVGEQKRMLFEGRNNLKRPPSLYTLETEMEGWQFNVLAVHLETGKLLLQLVADNSKGGGEATATEIEKLAQVREEVPGDLIIVGDFNMHLQEKSQIILSAIAKIDVKNPYQALIVEQPTMIDIRAGSNFCFLFLLTAIFKAKITSTTTSLSPKILSKND
jgi:hypothetical protein